MQSPIVIPFATKWWRRFQRLADLAHRQAWPRQYYTSTLRFAGDLKLFPSARDAHVCNGEGGLGKRLVFGHELSLATHGSQQDQWLSGYFQFDQIIIPRNLFNRWNQEYEHSGRDRHFDFNLDNGRESLIFEAQLQSWDKVVTVDNGHYDLCIIEQLRLHITNFYSNTLTGIALFLQEAIGQEPQPPQAPQPIGNGAGPVTVNERAAHINWDNLVPRGNFHFDQ